MVGREGQSAILGEAVRGLVDGSIEKTNAKLSKMTSFDEANLRIAFANLRNAIAYGYQRVINLEVNGRVFPLGVVRAEPGSIVIGDDEDGTDDMSVSGNVGKLVNETLGILEQFEGEVQVKVSLGDVRK
jgi:hypothetical protein